MNIRNQVNKWLTGIAGVAIAIGVIIIVWKVPAANQNNAPSPLYHTNTSETPVRPTQRFKSNGPSLPPPDDTFYRTIINNNLFRPLGWRPPRSSEPYRLIGTILSKDGNTSSQAILQATAGNTIYTLRVGGILGDSTLINIQPKQVTLKKDGTQRTLKLNTVMWLRHR